MAGEYINPASMFADPEQFKVGGRPNFMSGMVASQRQQQAAPFLEMARQQMQQQTDTGAQTLQEFMSPQGQATRTAQRQQIIDEGDVYARTKDAKVTQENEKARFAPFLTDQQIAEAEKNAIIAKHEQHSIPIKYFSGVANDIEKMPEGQRAAAYENHVAGSGFDRQKLPANLQRWTEPGPSEPGTMSHLAQARWAMIHDPDQMKKLEQEAVPAEASKEVARIGEAGKLAVINRQIGAGIYDDLARSTTKLERALRTGLDPDTGKPMDTEAKQATADSLRRIRSKNVMDNVTKATEMERLAKMIGDMSGDPIKKKAADDAYDEAHAREVKRYLAIEGLSPTDFSDPTGAVKKPKYKVGDTVNVGGNKYPIAKVNSDGSYHVTVGNQLRRIEPE